MLPWPSTQPVELLSQANLGACVMKCSSPSQVPVCGLLMRPLPPPHTTTMSPSLVLWMDLSCHSLVPSVFRLALSVPAVEVGAMKLYGKMGFEPRAQFLWKRLDS